MNTNKDASDTQTRALLPLAPTMLSIPVKDSLSTSPPITTPAAAAAAAAVEHESVVRSSMQDIATDCDSITSIQTNPIQSTNVVDSNGDYSITDGTEYRVVCIGYIDIHDTHQDFVLRSVTDVHGRNVPSGLC